jgi:uncharacterized membrane protein required for colicin V production
MVTLVDIGLGLLAFLSLVAGWRNGFLDSLLSLAAYLAGIVAAVQLTPIISTHLPPWAERVPGSHIVLGVFLFLAAFFLVRLIGAWQASGKSGARKHQEFSDQALGALFGLARGLFLATAIASFLVAYLPRSGRVFQESKSLPLLVGPGRVVAKLAPEGLRSRMTAGWAEMEEVRLRKPGRGGAVSI